MLNSKIIKELRMSLENLISVNNVIPDHKELQKELKEQNEINTLTTQDAEEINKICLDMMKKIAEIEFKVLTFQALKEANLFWQTNQSAMDDGDDMCFFGTRVRVQNNSLSAEWYNNYFHKPGGNSPLAENKTASVFSKYIKKGNKDGYSLSQFNNAPDWAKEVISIVENNYVQIRERSALLSKFRRWIKDYEKKISN